MRMVYFSALLGILTLYVRQAEGQSAADISKKIDKETQPAGATGRLNCSVTGIDKAGGDVLWTKLGSRPISISRNLDIVRFNQISETTGEKKYDIEMSRITKDTRVYTLVIRRLNSMDSGFYECKIYLPGINNDDLPKARGELVVQLPPSMSDSATTPLVQGIVGSTARLTCDASGVPAPKISWTRANGKSLPNGQQTIYGTQLIIKNITSEDGGVYRCTADNNVKPPATFDITLQVKTKPVAVPFRPAYGQATDKNLEVELACLISGDPQPDLYWFYIKDIEENSLKEIKDDHKHEVHKIGVYPGHNRRETDQWLTLRILQLQSGDYGLYKCMGRNKYGEGSAIIKLYSTPTCQGPLCQFESRKLGASSITGSVTLLVVTMVIGLLVGQFCR